MAEKWDYKSYQIQADLKPGAKHFQYFYSVFESGIMKCRYCVWIEDDALPRFDQSENFEAIVTSQKDAWESWVREKLDREDFRDLVLKLDKAGEQEIDLAALDEKLSPE